MWFELSNEGIMFLTSKKFIGDDEGLKTIARWKLGFDGTSNAMGHGIGFVLISSRNDYTPYTTRFFFAFLDNMEKYEVCIIGMKAFIDLRIKILEVYGDSMLVIYQVRGKWEPVILN